MSLTASVAVQRGDLTLDVDLVVPDGEVAALVGPNGAGKSTLLATLAGLLPLDAGRIALDGVVVDDVAAGVHVPAEQRAVGVVFQDLLLFPHLSVLDNVAFGPRSRGLSRGAAARRASEWLERVGIAHRAGSRPHQLSGGEAQRVALARALAVEPAVLLLDEPLSALDVGVRADVRRDLRRHLSGFAGACLVVTHDPVEALALADRLVVLERGRVVQEGAAADVARRPRSAWVAELVGLNLFEGRGEGRTVVLPNGQHLAVAEPVAGDVLALVHPHAVALHRAPPEGTPRNVWSGRVDGIDRLGERVRVRVDGPVVIVAEVTQAAVASLGLVEGSPVWATVKATEVAVYPA